MSMAAIDWQAVETLSGEPLKQRVFSILRQAALAINGTETDDPHLLEVVPRLAELLPKHEELKTFREAYSALARATGLWNYIDKETADLADRVVAETVTVPELEGLTLHREQMAALNDLFEGKNLILSAPTSFGKSLLIDALLASGRYKRVAIVLPTIALLDEFRRRLRRRFREAFNVVMHPGDKPGEGPIVFLGTQERLINRTDLGTLDLTVVDEFYKLDPNRRDERSVTLNAAVYKLLGRSRQFFFLGPNIDGVQVSPDGRWKFEFLRTRFSTVAVDTFDLTAISDKHARLFDEVGDDTNWPALVFVSSPDKANRLAAEAAEQMAVSDTSTPFSEWLRENVGAGWPLVKAVEYGFAIHHGRIPRAIASQMVRMFNTGDLPVLFCTSTLIEGVNTAAKTVLIFDKTISRSRYDFFTFANIRGRAGRLGQHHIGRVFLFNSPPEPELTEVSPTLFGDDDAAPDDYVVHLDEDDTSSEIDDRVAALRTALNLDTSGLRLAAAVGLDTAMALKGAVAAALRGRRSIIWSGMPRYEHIAAVSTLICSVRSAREFGAFSDKQLTLFISRLRHANTMRSFLLEYDQGFQGDRVGHDNVFKFLRACEYGLPQLFSVVEMFLKAEGHHVDYSLFLHDLSRWFRAEELKNLDEEGIPIQISERFYQEGDDRSALTERLTLVAQSSTSDLTEFERSWVTAALDLQGKAGASDM
ncbi:DEAD/DEAH box helicase [Tsuneonella sp. SYSU-LHT278]|uniref:DEAD/DEAH box helicase n=1 Tax=Tsuneonella sediminis TaxID=3416089 RepID=UPI003F7905E2